MALFAYYKIIFSSLVEEQEKASNCALLQRVKKVIKARQSMVETSCYGLLVLVAAKIAMNLLLSATTNPERSCVSLRRC